MIPDILDFTRVVRATAIAHAHQADPAEVADRLYGHTQHRHVARMLTKAAVDGGGTTGNSGELFSPGRVAAEFAAAVRPLEVFGSLQTRKVPIARELGILVGRSTFDFVAERSPIPCTSPLTSNVLLPLHKIAGIIVTSKELLEFGARAEQILQAEMIAGVVEAADRRLLDPTSTANSGRPASITSGVAALNAAAVDTAVELDDLILTMVNQLVAAGSPLTRAAFIAHTSNVASIALMRNGNGSPAYPGVTLLGGTIAGIPLVASGSAPVDGLTLVDAGELLEADDGVTTIQTTDAAMIDLDDAPDGSNRINVFQADCVAMKLIRERSWAMRNSGFVAYATNLVLPQGTVS